MTVTYKYIAIPKDTEAAIKILEKDLIPLFDKYWNEHGKPTYDTSASFNIQGFIQMWSFSGLALIGAYEDNKMVGYLLAILYTPMAYRANSAQIEQWYAETPAIEKGMFDYFTEIANFKDIDEVWTVSDRGAPEIPWTKKNTFTTTRYVKKD